MTTRVLGDFEVTKDGMIHFTTGPIKDHPGYALTKTRTVVRTQPKPLDKKERHKQRLAQDKQPHGYIFTCQCKRVCFHFRSTTKIRIEGYEDRQSVDTYECCLCHSHVFADRIDDAIERSTKKPKP